jgi:hypothetical protein
MAILVSAFILLIVDLFAKSCNQRKRDPSSSTKVLSFCADVKRNQNLPQMGPLSCPNVCFRAQAEHSGVAFPIQGCKHVRRSSALAITSSKSFEELFQYSQTITWQNSGPINTLAPVHFKPHALVHTRIQGHTRSKTSCKCLPRTRSSTHSFPQSINENQSLNEASKQINETSLQATNESTHQPSRPTIHILPLWPLLPLGLLLRVVKALLLQDTTKHTPGIRSVLQPS